MLNLPLLLKRAEKLVSDNSPLIMTVIGVGGTVATAYLTGRATYKYMGLLAEEGYYDRDYKFERSKKEHVQAAWKFYIPAIGTGLITVTAIVFSHHVSARRAAAIVSAYAISEKAFEEYREKVLEKMGDKKELAIRDEIVKDHMTKNPASRQDVIIVSGEVLCLDTFSGRYFPSDMESIRRAQNDINEQIIHSHYASLGDFYDKLGLKQTNMSEEMGWNLDKMLEISYSTQMSDDNRPCIAITYEVSPARSYFRLG